VAASEREPSLLCLSQISGVVIIRDAAVEERMVGRAEVEESQAKHTASSQGDHLLINSQAYMYSTVYTEGEFG